MPWGDSHGWPPPVNTSMTSKEDKVSSHFCHRFIGRVYRQISNSFWVSSTSLVFKYFPWTNLNAVPLSSHGISARHTLTTGTTSASMLDHLGQYSWPRTCLVSSRQAYLVWPCVFHPWIVLNDDTSVVIPFWLPIYICFFLANQIWPWLVYSSVWP
jgi:hypothetical protein